MQLSFTVLKLWYFLYRYKNPYFKNLSKNGRNSMVNISKTKSRRYIFLCIFGKSMSKLTNSRIFMKKSFGNPYCIVFPYAIVLWHGIFVPKKIHKKSKKYKNVHFALYMMTTPTPTIIYWNNLNYHLWRSEGWGPWHWRPTELYTKPVLFLYMIL